ncbi:hypothetical protein [Spiroplasma attinicola]|uniref:hypothetical protein n=1 Tax=Spiroplasma attinicola TaxID=2904537 RepID=UPI0020229FE1|nr:hypothetical protein [Spiroplasma sp. JKS002670]MCL8210088.1 hypothetical protein [Spiroplasma sp. JKS002670]
MIEENNYEQDTEYDWKDIDELFPKNPWFKKALVKPFNKLIFALALTGAVTGSISLIIGSVAIHKTDYLNYYLNQGYKAIWGKGTIWKSSEDSFYLYFGKKINENDTKWDGTYPKGYFD